MEKQQEGSVSVVTKAHLVHGRFYSARNRKKSVNHVNSREPEMNIPQHGTGGIYDGPTASRSHREGSCSRLCHRQRQKPNCPPAGKQSSAAPSCSVTLTFKCHVLTHLSTGYGFSQRLTSTYKWRRAYSYWRKADQKAQSDTIVSLYNQFLIWEYPTLVVTEAKHLKQ